METTYHTITTHGFVILYETYSSYLFIKLPLRKRFKKIPSSIPEHLWFKDYHTLYIGLYYFHLLYLLVSVQFC